MPNQVLKLKHDRENRVAEHKSMLDRAEDERRDLTGNERRRADEIEREVEEIDKEIDAVEAGLEKDRAAAWARVHAEEGRLTLGGPAADRSYFGMFPNLERSTDGFETFNDFLKPIQQGLFHPNLRAGATEGVPAEGGFFVPTEFAAQMLDASLEAEIVRPRARIEPMKFATKKIAGFDTSDHTSSIGGFTARWLQEAGSATEDTPKTRQIELIATKLAVFTKASNELIEDGTNFEDRLSEMMVLGAGWGLDLAFLSGTGAGQPLGVLKDPALIVVAKESGQGANTILYENLTKMFARLHPASVKNAVWVANSTTIPQLLTLSLAVGTGGSAVPVMSEGPDGQFRILTRPILFTEKVPALGSEGDILLADFSNYVVGLRADVLLQKSIHVGFQSDESAYRVILRADGQGLWSKAMTPKNGDTLSWVVTLAVRA